MSEFVSKSLGQIAEAIRGEVNDEKHKSLRISSIASSPVKSSTDDLVFIYEPKYLKDIQNIKAKALVLPLDLKEKLQNLPFPIIWAKRPRLVLKFLLETFEKQKFYSQPGIHPSAVVDPSSSIAKNVAIGPNVFVGPNCKIEENTKINPNVYIGSNVAIGKNCIINANCTIMDYSRIGNNVILHSGVVIGADGYSYVTEDESNLEKVKKGDFNLNSGRQVQHKIPSTGSVVIEDDVEIGANSCVDAGTIGPTVIGAGTKIDNLVQIAHNCKIGKDCLIVAQVGFAGSVVTGDRIIAGGQSGFADNINIGSDVIFMARCGAHGNVPANNVYMGYPGVPYMEFIRGVRDKKRLPRKQEKLEEQVKLLEEKLKELEGKLKTKV